MLVRSAADTNPAGEVGTAHLLPLPLTGRRYGNNLAVLYCGAVLPVADLEALDRAEKSAGDVVCRLCVTAHRTGHPPAPLPGLDPYSDPSLSGRVAAARSYVRHGWSILLQEGQVRLSLDTGPVAIAMPEDLATAVTEVLEARHCSPAVLTHPGLRSQRVFVVRERFPVALGWPPKVRRLASGSVPLPPSPTSYGRVHWVRPPEPGPLGLCREIDIVAALRTVHHDTSGPGGMAAPPAVAGGAVEPATAPVTGKE